ncbi:MAG: protein kinase [Deltaproteobacteria bacterium]|nr:protein kinase [Deltaproteobacteria bacterium]
MSVHVGRYQLVKCLARGGMAEIWLAQQRAAGGFEKLVAVKRILPGLADREEFIKMFLDEARLAAQLGHPNIVQIYDLGRTGDTYYIAMEFIHGENLRMITRRAEEAAGVPVPMAVKMISEAAAALHYAHHKTAPDGTPLGVVHRDISPQNLLVSYEGQVKVVDFGIAKAANSLTETRTGVIKGKYPYMSPEQVLARKIDGRSDLFSLGIVLWETLTGKRLYDQPTDFLVMDAIIKKAHPPASSIRDDIPESLDELLAKAMAKRVEDRYESCHAFHQALERWLHQNGQMVGAVEIGAFMKATFPDRLATWSKLLEQRDQADFSSEVLDELSGFMGMTPSSELGTGAPERVLQATRALRPGQRSSDAAAQPERSESLRRRAALSTGPTPETSQPSRPSFQPPNAPAKSRYTDPGVRPPSMLEEAPDAEDEDELVEPPPLAPVSQPKARPLPEPEPEPEDEDEWEDEYEEEDTHFEPVPKGAPPPPEPRREAPAPKPKPKPKPKKAKKPKREKRARVDTDSPLGGRRRSLREVGDRVFEPAATGLGRLLQGALALLTIVGMIWAGQGLVQSAGLKGKEKEIAKGVAADLAQGAGIVTPGVILANSFPSGAEVRVDGKLIGKTPLSQPLQAKGRQAEITLRLKGYLPWRRTVQNPAEGVRIEAQLEPELGPIRKP